MRAPKELRAGNVGTVVAALRRHGTTSRTDLAQVTGLSRTTVLSILDELEAAGVAEVRERSVAEQRGLGRPPAMVALRSGAGVALGLCVADGRVHAVVTDLSLDVVAEHAVRADAPTPAVLATAAGAVLDGASGELVGAVVGAPRGVEVDAAALAARVGAPVEVEDDADVEALGELALGAARGRRHLIHVHVDRDIGGALVLDGRLRRGRAGMAGELGHVPVPGVAGPECDCGRRDCLRCVASGWALLQAMVLTHGSGLTLDRLVELADGGDPGARRALADAGDAIGTVVAGLCSGLNPEAVVVGGPLSFAGSPLVEALRDRVTAEVHHAAAPVAVLRAELGDRGGALGAAAAVVRSAERFPHHFGSV